MHGTPSSRACQAPIRGRLDPTLCALTFMCIGPFTAYGKPDIHPTDAGYAVIGDQFWKASGYARLLDEDN